MMASASDQPPTASHSSILEQIYAFLEKMQAVMDDDEYDTYEQFIQALINEGK